MTQDIPEGFVQFSKIISTAVAKTNHLANNESLRKVTMQNSFVKSLNFLLQNENIKMDSYVDLYTNRFYNIIVKKEQTVAPSNTNETNKPTTKPKVNNGWNSCLYIDNFMPSEDDLINLWLK